MVVDIHESVQKKHKKKKTNSINEEEMKGEVIDLTRHEKDSSFVFSKNERSRKRTRKAEETEEVESSKKKQKTCSNRESSSEEIGLTSSVTEVSETKRSKKDKKSNEETEEAENSIRKKKKKSSNRESSSEEIVLASSVMKRSKKDKKSKEEINLGVVDTDILQQAGINLGLPMEDTETSLPETPKVKKKKKDKEKDTPTPSDKNKNERTLDYLRSWHSNQKKWKFNKMLQVHLLHIMYDKSLLNDGDFDVMLLYLEGLNGKSREKTIEDAEKIINNDKQDTDSSNVDKEERARQIIQILS
ncbi:myb-like protein X [Biomphalaria pfeifferi]|uniref:Myb-like protein X n=1 Tax=Biomphalaria pfeifferi TaxID=112525 RepID=A0AAD8BQI8_BIOPF|nr:myb-like protein X [Biomphalaria pfeifferi]